MVLIIVRKIKNDECLTMELRAENLLCDFFDVVKEDPRIGLCHVSLYMSLVAHYIESGTVNPFSFPRKLIMQKAKINSRCTYNKAISELALYKYLHRLPSYSGLNHSVYLRRLLPKKSTNENG